MPWLRVTALRKLSDQIDISDNSVCPPPFARFFETNKSPFPTLVDLSSRHFPYSIFERLAVVRTLNSFGLAPDLVTVTSHSPKILYIRFLNFLRFSGPLHSQ